MSEKCTLRYFNDIPAVVEKELEEFVCILYGYKKIKSVNEVRSAMFIQKFQRNGKALDGCWHRSCHTN